MLERLKRRLARLHIKLSELQKIHLGNETSLTYWGGYDMGYIKGQIAAIEDLIDDLNDKLNILNTPNHDN